MHLSLEYWVRERENVINILDTIPSLNMPIHILSYGNQLMITYSRIRLI